MKRLLIIALLFAVGCTPIALYNAKVDKINNHWTYLKGQSNLSQNETVIAWWENVKVEFPEYSYRIDRCLDLVNSGISVRQCEEDFWKIADQDANARQAQWSQGMMNMSNTYNNQLNQQQQYYNNLNQQNRAVNCTTFFHSNNTANTSCY